jgi:hypothetical protein
MDGIENLKIPQNSLAGVAMTNLTDTNFTKAWYNIWTNSPVMRTNMKPT